MALTSSEVESLRFHLGYGNISEGAYPYTPDGFKEIFEQVIAPNLTGSTETSATNGISAGSTATVTPVSMTGIVVNARLVVDVDEALEIVTVKAVTVSTFTAAFTKAHAASGYPVALMGGHARLRMLLRQADVAWQAFQDAKIVDTPGALKSVDKGDVEWYEGKNSSALEIRETQYLKIVKSISSLVRVQPLDDGSCSARVEAY